MMEHRVVLAFVLSAAVISAAAQGQQVQVSKGNRAIAVSATVTIEAKPEVAVVELGYMTEAATHDGAYEDCVRTSNKILAAFRDSGVAKTDIETKVLRLTPTRSEGRSWIGITTEKRGFEATQLWSVRLPAKDAAKIVDLAVKTGANQVLRVDWKVRDPGALESRAVAAALGRARSLAQGMAVKMGEKIGALLFASNDASDGASPRYFGGHVGGNRSAVVRAQLEFRNDQVSSRATVYAVFAVE